MTAQDYQRCMDWTKKKIGTDRVRFLVKLLTAITAACYIMSISWLACRHSIRVIRMTAVPAAGFLLISLFRKWIAAKRPYEIYHFTPLLDKDTRGNSFPSRHVFSNMIIAMAVMSVWMPAGVFLIVCGVLLAVLRVITGVHFPKDVIAGGGAAVLLGVLGFYVL